MFIELLLVFSGEETIGVLSINVYEIDRLSMLIYCEGE